MTKEMTIVKTVPGYSGVIMLQKADKGLFFLLIGNMALVKLLKMGGAEMTSESGKPEEHVMSDSWQHQSGVVSFNVRLCWTCYIDLEH